jgi:hypothetical protein
MFCQIQDDMILVDSRPACQLCHATQLTEEYIQGLPQCMMFDHYLAGKYQKDKELVLIGLFGLHMHLVEPSNNLKLVCLRSKISRSQQGKQFDLIVLAQVKHSQNAHCQPSDNRNHLWSHCQDYISQLDKRIDLFDRLPRWCQQSDLVMHKSKMSRSYSVDTYLLDTLFDWFDW